MENPIDGLLTASGSTPTIQLRPMWIMVHRMKGMACVKFESCFEP